MNKNLTLTIIKPDAVSNGHTGAILDLILNAGFTLSAMKLLSLTNKDAQQFYAVHKDRIYFDELVDFMVSGPVVVAVLKKENAVLDFRKLIGVTNPKEAEEGTIRKLFATSKEENAIHGSDSDENALIEAHFFFPEREIL